METCEDKIAFLEITGHWMGWKPFKKVLMRPASQGYELFFPLEGPEKPPGGIPWKMGKNY